MSADNMICSLMWGYALRVSDRQGAFFCAPACPEDMKQIDFKEANKLIGMVSSLDEALSAVMSDAAAQEEAVRSAAGDVIDAGVTESLSGIPVGELRRSKAGIRISALEEAGYTDLARLYRASDQELMNVNGIGEKQVTAVRTIIAVFRREIAERKTLLISMDDMSEQNLRLIRAVAAYRLGEEIRRDAGPVRREFHACVQDILPRIVIRSSLRWLFSFRKTKDSSAGALEELAQFAVSPLYERAGRLCARYRELSGIGDAETGRDFEQHGAEYYALLEKYVRVLEPAGLSGDLPADLAAKIDALTPDLAGFSGNLRSYQAFGVKYILHQKKVLLGDDMGLGKTIQAIAAMSHLYAADGGAHFLVICPAGVLINWCREIRKFSSIPAYLIHGEELERQFRSWQESGGAAVTNYETIGRIIGRVNRDPEHGSAGMDIALLAVDEAHYIKNPSARRTKYVRMLEDEAQRILLMTGTPLENRVSEMCELIGFIRPELAEEIRGAAALSRTREFRRMISPVYLRRRREDVLRELPPAEAKEEWCRMTPGDLEAYAKQINAGNFTGARRVGFLQESLETSSKAVRLEELCRETEAAGRKAVVYSYFRDTIEKVRGILSGRCAGGITGSTPAADRQKIIDEFAQAEAGSVLICQVQAGGTGLNIQSASIVIFCEPQIKPSLIHQAIARSWRMGQVRNVQVHYLLCEDTVDEAVIGKLEEKQLQFDLYADESSVAQAADELLDTDWIRAFMEQERSRYLPAVVPQ